MYDLRHGTFGVIRNFLDSIRATDNLPDHGDVCQSEIRQAFVSLEKLKTLVDKLKQGKTELFNQLFPNASPFSQPNKSRAWSQEVLREAGFPPELANPKTFGHREIKGIIYIDVDGTLSDHKTWTPETALQHALFVAERAKEGYVVIPVTGSAMEGGEGVTNMQDRFLRGEMLATPVVCTRGGSEAWELEGGQYKPFEPYVEMMESLRTAVTPKRWKELAEGIQEIVASEINAAFGQDWTTDSKNVQYFNNRYDALKRKEEGETFEEIPRIIVQNHTPVKKASKTGCVNFHVTVLDHDKTEQVMNSISAKIKKFLEDKGYPNNLVSFHGIEDNFGTDGPVLQYFLDFSVYRKSTARFIQGHLQELLGIPLAQNPKIHFAGNANNDGLFVCDRDSQKGEAGVFLIQPGREARLLAASIRSSGWTGRVIEMGGDDHLCIRLLRNFRRLDD